MESWLNGTHLNGTHFNGTNLNGTQFNGTHFNGTQIASSNTTNAMTSAVHQATKMVEGGFLSGRNPFEFSPSSPLPTFIVQLLLIVTMSRIVKFILSPIRQPAVISEIISGIILGPTAFGHIPGYTAIVFPKISLPFLNLMSNFGLVLFLFLVGLELDPTMLKESIKKSLSISLAGMILPFGLGAATSYGLYHFIEPLEYQNSFLKYFLFLGVAMAITAFPVLARILSELNLLKTKVGTITMAAAATDDATSWCLLALVISLINAGTGLIAVYVFLIGLGYTLFLLLAVRPLFIWVLQRNAAFEKEPSQFIMFLIMMLVFTSAFITDAIGIHAIFGGFVAGIMMPHEGGFAYKITKKLEDIVAVLFLPLYFALSGLKTQVGSINDGASWLMLLLVILAACCGKIAGCTAAAKLSRMSWRESFTIGVLMNCKGLVELIVLNLGYDAQIISVRTFSIMVVMALVTTFLTVPIVTYIFPVQYRHLPEDSDKFQTDLSRDHPGDFPPDQSRLLVCVNEIEHVPSILSVMHLFQTGGREPEPKNVENTGKITLSNLKGPKTGKKVKIQSKKMMVSALRLIEITERDSSVMIQTSPESLREDPVMKMIESFGMVTSFDIRGLVEVVTPSLFAPSIIRAATRVRAAYIIIPWCGNTSMMADSPTPRRLSFLQRRSSRSVTTTHKRIEFIEEILASPDTPSSVLILIDRSIDNTGTYQQNQNSINGIVTSYQQIYLLFLGGPDDRRAVEIVLATAGQHKINIHIVRFKNPANYVKSRSGSGSGSGVIPMSGSGAGQDGRGLRSASVVSSAGSEEPFNPQDPQDLVLAMENDALDDEIFNNHFNTALARDEFHNLTYTEIQTTNPIPTAVESVKNFDHSYLVFVGREHEAQMADCNFKNVDPERRKILGDVAESILLSSCTSSVLVIQAKTH